MLARVSGGKPPFLTCEVSGVASFFPKLIAFQARTRSLRTENLSGWEGWTGTPAGLPRWGPRLYPRRAWLATRFQFSQNLRKLSGRSVAEPPREKPVLIFNVFQIHRPQPHHRARHDHLQRTAGFRFFAVPVKVKSFGTFPVRAFAMVPND